MALYNIKLENAKLHIAKGNTKIGKTIYSFSTLPGNKEHLIYAKGILLTDIPGTCTNLCEGCFGACYAVNSAQRHHNAVIQAWAENTLLLRNKPKELFDEIDKYITEKNIAYYNSQGVKDRKITTWRWNVSGEIQNVQELEMMNNLARKHPEVQFGIYTKNFTALGKLLDKIGDTEPNFAVNVSQWHHVADEFLAKYPNKCNVFEYDDSNLKHHDLSEEDVLRLEKVTHCPAVTKEGHHATLPNGESITCDRCKRCYTKTGRHTAVYSH
jgi:hypothetical protein